MSPVEQLVSDFQELVDRVPEVVQPLIIMLAGVIPFVEGEVGALIGVIGGLNPVVAGVAAATGNFLSVLVVVTVTSRARTAVVGRRPSRVAVTAGAGAWSGVSGPAYREAASPQPESRSRQRLSRWVVRFGVPGASILGPLAVPTQITSAILVGGGTSRRWVLLWQAVAIVLWTTISTVSVWVALTYVIEVP